MTTNPERSLNYEAASAPRRETNVSTRFKASDVTDKKTPQERILFGLAHVLTAEEYTVFHKDYDKKSRNNPDLQRDLLEKVTADKFSASSHSRLKAASNKENGFVGSLRFTRGSLDLVPPIESMNLYQPPAGGWPHLRDGLRDDQIGEFGRIATMREERKKGNTKAILHSLFDAGFKDAREHEIEQAYIIMPTAAGKSQLRDHLYNLGYNPTIVQGAELRLEDPTVADVATTFSNYWFTREPKLHVMTIPPAA